MDETNKTALTPRQRSCSIYRSGGVSISSSSCLRQYRLTCAWALTGDFLRASATVPTRRRALRRNDQPEIRNFPLCCTWAIHLISPTSHTRIVRYVVDSATEICISVEIRASNLLHHQSKSFPVFCFFAFDLFIPFQSYAVGFLCAYNVCVYICVCMCSWDMCMYTRIRIFLTSLVVNVIVSCRDLRLFIALKCLARYSCSCC